MLKKQAHKGKREERNRKPAAEVNAPAQPSPPEYEQRENWYSPELARWSECPEADKDDPRSFRIYESSGAPYHKNTALLATVTIAPEFGPEDAKDIAQMMSCAPALFRALRTIAVNALDHIDGLQEFADALETLWMACGKYPYEWPHPDEKDDQIGEMVNACRGRMPKPNPS